MNHPAPRSLKSWLGLGLRVVLGAITAGYGILLLQALLIALLPALGRCRQAVVTEQPFHGWMLYRAPHYTYQLRLDGELYAGDSRQTLAAAVGDSVCVAYLPWWPWIRSAKSVHLPAECPCAVPKP